MNVIGPVVIVIESLWIFVLLLRVNALKRFSNQMTGYLAGILNNANIIKESLTTLSLHYGIEVEDLVEMLERKQNESK